MLGQLTTHHRSTSSENPRRKRYILSSSVAAKISSLSIDKDSPVTLRQQLVAYLKRSPQNFEDNKWPDRNDSSCDAGCEEQPRCLLGFRTCSPSAVLTRHVRERHVNNFQRRFACLECEQLGLKTRMIEAQPTAR